jgi:hypothetical protein
MCPTEGGEDKGPSFNLIHESPQPECHNHPRLEPTGHFSGAHQDGAERIWMGDWAADAGS